MFANVLLPIDLNHPASWEKALPIAAGVTASDGTLHLLAIVHDIGSGVVAAYLPKGFEEDALKRMKTELDAFVADNAPDGVTVAAHVGHGHVPETVLRIADKAGADLVVMASHPPDELRHLLVGSYAEKVVRHAPIPVMVVR